MTAVIFRDEAIANAREFVDRLKFRAPGIYRSILIEASEVLERIEHAQSDSVADEIFRLDDRPWMTGRRQEEFAMPLDVTAAPVHPELSVFDGSQVGAGIVSPSDDVWYWARDRQRQCIGVGKFMRPQGRYGDWTFWVNGVPYSVWMFEFYQAAVPPCIDSVRPRVPCP